MKNKLLTKHTGDKSAFTRNYIAFKTKTHITSKNGKWMFLEKCLNISRDSRKTSVTYYIK